MNQITIIKLKNSDWKIYKEIRLQMLKEEPEAYLRTYDEMINMPDGYWKEKTLDKDSGILAIFVDGKLAGMVGYFYSKADLAEIWGMFVRREYRGLGLGKKLIEEVEKEISKNKNIKKIKIEVTSTQIPAYTLYKKMGFIEVARKKNVSKVNGELFDDVVFERIIY